MSFEDFKNRVKKEVYNHTGRMPYLADAEYFHFYQDNDVRSAVETAIADQEDWYEDR